MEKSHSTLSRYLSYTRTTLYSLSLWPVSEKTERDSSVQSLISYLHFFVVTSTMIIRTVQILIDGWINYTNFESAAEMIGPTMALVTSFGKVCIYRRHGKTLNRLMGSLESISKNDSSKLSDILGSYVKLGNPAFLSLLSATWLLSVSYLGAPLFAQGRVLPFPFWPPFDYEESIILYILAYSHQILVTYFGCCTTSIEITFVLLIFHCCAKFKLIQVKLETIAHDSNNHENQENLSNNIGVELSSIVKLHCEVLRDIHDINLAFTYIVSVLFFAAVIAICCTGLQITSGLSGSTSWTIVFLILTMYYAEGLLVYYLPGEMLANQAMAVSLSAYMCGWECFKIKDQKTIGLMIVRSQVPPRLLAGQLSPLRLENYTTFLTTTGSYFTSISAVA